MATIASLVIALSAKTDAMTAGFSKAEKDYQKWVDKFDQRQAELKLQTETAREQLDRFAAHAVKKMVGIAAAISAAINFTKSLADAMEKANQTGSQLAMGSMLGTAIGDAVKGIPVLGDVTRIMAASWDNATGFANELQRIAEIEQIIAQNKEMLPKVVAMTGDLDALQRASRWALEFSGAMNDTQRACIQFSQDLENIKLKFDGMRTAIQAMGSFMRPGALEELESARAMQVQALEATFQHARALREQAEAEKELAAATRLADEAQRQQQAIMDRGKQIFDQTRTPVERFAAQLDELQKLVSAGAIGWETYQRAVMQANEALERTESSPARILRVGSPAAVERRLSLGSPGAVLQRTSFSEVDKESKIANRKADERKAILQQQLDQLRIIREQTNFVMADF